MCYFSKSENVAHYMKQRIKRSQNKHPRAHTHTHTHTQTHTVSVHPTLTQLNRTQQSMQGTRDTASLRKLQSIIITVTVSSNLFLLQILRQVWQWRDQVGSIQRLHGPPALQAFGVWLFCTSGSLPRFNGFPVLAVDVRRLIASLVLLQAGLRAKVIKSVHVLM